MRFTWNQIIDRARTYVDDDHAEEAGWITPAKWLVLANVEYAQLYRRWVRTGLVAPEPLDHTLADASDTVDDVLALVGVAEQLGTEWRVLNASQPMSGRKPFRSSVANTAESWDAFGTGDRLTITIHPPATSGTYVVRYIARPDYATDPTDYVYLPYGGDERLALGLARRAHVKDSTASALLNGLISEADAELSLTAAGRGVRFNITPVKSTPRNEWPRFPGNWLWL